MGTLPGERMTETEASGIQEEDFLLIQGVVFQVGEAVGLEGITRVLEGLGVKGESGGVWQGRQYNIMVRGTKSRARLSRLNSWFCNLMAG